MTWKPTPGKQADSIRDSTSRINIWHGSVRSSKTVGCNLRFLQFIGLMNKLRVPGDMLMWGKTERTLKHNILDPMRDFLGPKAFRLNRGEGEAYIWGRKIHVIGANDERAEGKIRGSTYLGALGDELTLTPESFFKMALSRLSLPGAKLLGTTNPDGPYNYIKEQFIDRESELDLKSFHFLLEDNPHLPPEYVAELKKEYTGLWYKRYILGLWVQAAGAVYDMWDDDLLTPITDLDLSRRNARNQGWFVDIDYGTANPCTFSLKRYWWEGDLFYVHTEKEYYYDSKAKGKQKTDEEYLDDLVKFIEGYPGKIKIYCDPSALSFIVAGKKRRLLMVEADNSVLEGIRFVSSLLSAKRLTFDPSCKQTAKSYQSYLWDEKAQKKGEDKPLKENDHCCDRDRYGVYTQFGGERRSVYGAHVNT